MKGRHPHIIHDMISSAASGVRRNLRTGLALASALGATALPAAAPAQCVWTNAAGGNWDVAANWQGGAVPGTGSNVSITADGTYTSRTWNVSAVFGDISLGESSSAGTQYLLQDQYNLWGYNNLSIGSRGVFVQEHNVSVSPVGSIEVKDGGRYELMDAQWRDYGRHTLLARTGGTLRITAGATLATQTDWPSTNTLDGTVDGPGDLYMYNDVTWVGSGSFEGAGAIQSANDWTLGGTLSVNRAISQNGGALRFADGAHAAFNANVSISNMTFGLTVPASSASATVTGSGDLRVFYTSSSRFGGLAPWGAGGGTLSVEGSGFWLWTAIPPMWS